MNLFNLTFLPILGNQEAKNLYTLTIVDTEDTEDTTTNLFLADDEADLYNQVKGVFISSSDPNEFEEDEDEFSGSSLLRNFDDEWGISILWTLIGTKA